MAGAGVAGDAGWWMGSEVTPGPCGMVKLHVIPTAGLPCSEIRTADVLARS